jgi:lysophospholipase
MPTKSLLVLYTGGTIGMVVTDKGYDVKPGYLQQVISQKSEFNDQQSCNASKCTNSTTLVISNTPKGNRVIYEVVEYSPLLDSSDMDVGDWLRIAGDIAQSYQKYDGFIVLHGTDTMAYTASALSFMLGNLGKPVVVTGAQIPISQLRNDASDNLLEALLVAADFAVPEVMICFGHKLLRGNRTTKASSNQLDAFQSPNCGDLGKIGIDFSIDWQRVRRPDLRMPFPPQVSMSKAVGILHLFPGIMSELVRSFLNSGLKGVVLKTFGAGNFSQDKSILDAFRNASHKGICLVNSTQCYSGGVESAYAAGQALAGVGIVPVGDITTEAALTKLSFLIAQGFPPEVIRAKMAENLAGELTTKACNFGETKFIDAVAEAMHTATDEESKQIADALTPVLLCTYASQNNADKVDELLSSGINPNVADYDRRTASHLASANNSVETLEILMKYGADLSQKDSFGHTPLYEACLFGHKESVSKLLIAGAVLNFSNTTESCSMYCNMVKDGNVEALELWGKAGADFNVSDYDGRTPLHVAESEGQDKIKKILFSYGVKPTKDRWGNTPSQ